MNTPEEVWLQLTVMLKDNYAETDSEKARLCGVSASTFRRWKKKRAVAWSSVVSLANTYDKDNRRGRPDAPIRNLKFLLFNEDV